MIFSYVNSAKHLEHRLTSLELKVEPLWAAVSEEIPKLLIRQDTPKLDILLRLASDNLDSMTDKQIHDMICMLDDEYLKAVKNRESGRAVGISLFRATLKGRHKK